MRASIAASLFVLATLGCGAGPDVVAGTTERPNEWQHASAGFVGCRAADITISEHGEDNYAHSWIASCHGRDYVCSLLAGANADCEPSIEPTSGGSVPTVFAQ